MAAAGLQTSSRGAARPPLPITSHHPHPEPLPKSRLPASIWSKLSAPCSGLWPGLGVSRVAPGSRGRGMASLSGQHQPATSSYTSSQDTGPPRPSAGPHVAQPLARIPAHSDVPAGSAWRRWSPGAPTQGASHRGARATLWPTQGLGCAVQPLHHLQSPLLGHHLVGTSVPPGPDPNRAP